MILKQITLHANSVIKLEPPTIFMWELNVLSYTLDYGAYNLIDDSTTYKPRLSVLDFD